MQTHKQTAIYVYEAPVRVWHRHWVNALSITLLAVTGYLIAKPPPSLSGEASDHFLMGYIRFVHFAAAYVFTIGVVEPLYWALVGNEHAKEPFRLPVFRRSFRTERVHEVRWYAVMEKEPKKTIGHNPLAHVQGRSAVYRLSAFHRQW